jgi:hypothetical protein
MVVCVSWSGASDWDEPVAPSRREEFQQIVSRLDLGGELLFVAHTRGLVDGLFHRLQPEGLPPDHPDARLVQMRIDALDGFLRKHGFYAVHGVGVSSVPSMQEDYLTRVFLLRDYVDSNLPLWRGLVGWQPRRMSALDFLPPTTAIIQASTAEFGQLWNVVSDGVAESGSETLREQFDLFGKRMEAVLGTPMAVLADAIRDETLFSVQVSAERQAAIPTSSGVVTVAEPAFLLCLAQSDPTLRSLLEAQFALRGFAWREGRMGDVTIRTLDTPLPAPFPLQPALASVSGYLLVSSTEENLREAISAYRHRSGLVARPRFKHAVRGIDMVNNAFFYRSEEGAALINAMRVASEMDPFVSGEHPAAAHIADQALGYAPATPHAVAVFNWKSGIMVVANHADGGRPLLERLAGVPLSRWLAPARRARWISACNRVLDLLALPAQVDEPGEKK